MRARRERVIYLAGGCFWGVEKLMRSIHGVIDAVSGYANGRSQADANYAAVCRGDTGFRETVRVTYDPTQVSLEGLLLAYFYVIDPVAVNRQGNDIGPQYQAGVYYDNDDARAVVERIAAMEAGCAPGFAVEIGPLQNFYPAEEYHQDYLDKHPRGYCHIPLTAIRLLSGITLEPGQYNRPAKETVRQMQSNCSAPSSQCDAEKEVRP